jgi:DNA-nicking Smr family endonuclease
MPEESQNVSEEDAVPIVINGELDLHAFRPSDLGSLLPEYFAECRKRNILTVRVVHGKGTGALREGVHQLLQRTRGIVDWTWPVAPHYGGWGATFVRLSCIDCEQG